jgi:hypothetical protein
MPTHITPDCCTTAHIPPRQSLGENDAQCQAIRHISQPWPFQHQGTRTTLCRLAFAPCSLCLNPFNRFSSRSWRVSGLIRLTLYVMTYTHTPLLLTLRSHCRRTSWPSSACTTTKSIILAVSSYSTTAASSGLFRLPRSMDDRHVHAADRVLHWWYLSTLPRPASFHEYVPMTCALPLIHLSQSGPPTSSFVRSSTPSTRKTTPESGITVVLAASDSSSTLSPLEPAGVSETRLWHTILLTGTRRFLPRIHLPSPQLL